MTALARILRALEIPLLVAVPATLLLCAYLNVNQSALLTMVVALVAIALFVAQWEVSQPPLAQLMPTAVLAAVAAAGRVAFAAIPDVKPVSAICIIAGAVFGKRSGFMVGVLAALVSNMYFGQGPWTPWQMYAWGLMGYVAGCIGDTRFNSHPWLIPAIGVAGPLLYGFVLNSWYIVGYVHPLTLPKAALAYWLGFQVDLIHCIATVVFLGLLYVPWRRKLTRIKEKFALG